MANHKIERIASDISKYLSNILYTETRDELLKTITITGVDINKDLSIAKVYFTSISSLTKEDITKEINEASPYLRGCLAKVIEIRNIPELRFIYDESIEYGTNIERIISKIHE